LDLPSSSDVNSPNENILVDDAVPQRLPELRIMYNV